MISKAEAAPRAKRAKSGGPAMGVLDVPPCLEGFEAVSRTWDRSMGSAVARLMPGEFYVTPHDEVLSTVLGSCVSACICVPRLMLGGMNHFMLPSTATPASSAATGDAMYGTVAMERLVNELVKRGAKRSELEVKIVGGGQMYLSRAEIGQGNVDFVFEYLRVEGLTVVGQDVGGSTPRRVLYYPRTGRLRVRKLPAVDRDSVEKSERAYIDKISLRPKSGTVELFGD